MCKLRNLRKLHKHKLCNARRVKGDLPLLSLPWKPLKTIRNQ